MTCTNLANLDSRIDYELPGEGRNAGGVAQRILPAMPTAGQ